ncbi:MAG: HAD-IA family hydrolase [Candidatus Sulfobium sp.]|jgi:putative hydrolase of the HAD superfamily
MPPVRALFLDIGGVMLENGWGHEKRKRAADHFGFDIDELNERHHLTFDTYEEGKLTLDTYLDRVIFYEERSFPREDLKEFMFRTTPYPETIGLFRELKKKYGLKVAAVSNEGRELTDRRVRDHGLAEFIDFFIVSCFVHFRKPDEDIYRIALDAAQVPPENVVYIDDRGLYVEVARTLGINGIHHVDHASTARALSRFGLSL